MFAGFNQHQGIAAKHAFCCILASGIIFCECGSSLPVGGR